MASHKRKREAFDDSDEDAPSYGKQILPVADLPDDFSGEPLDGMQYLFLVRRDARKRPDTVRAHNPYEKPEVLIAERIAPERSSAQSFLPTEAWRDKFQYRLGNFRKNFSQPTIYVGTVNGTLRHSMPDKKDRDRWWAFISGRPEAEWTSGKAKGKLSISVPLGRQVTADDKAFGEVSNTLSDIVGANEHALNMDGASTLPSPAGTPAPLSLEYLESLSQLDQNPEEDSVSNLRQFEESLTPREPTTELVKLIDERYALHLLMYFTHWINLYIKAPDRSPHLPTESHARWIFSLLSRIDEHVSADDMNLLRNLARSCIALLKIIKQQQASLSQNSTRQSHNKMKEASCWIIITAIVSTWKQRDLWMDAEDMIRRLDS
ncbi:hypothetical protein CVT26_010695 [Gymnopilus dilepis]|uniref:Uncharacterized protein n=1 Tax=Gymnopilus dilepis TaxID=231916 RepID=A0A409VI51_9AGAR|nr:hypothetical protein CVT26_010695 [Gymnopilus dilepis]